MKEANEGVFVYRQLVHELIKLDTIIFFITQFVYDKFKIKYYHITNYVIT